MQIINAWVAAAVGIGITVVLVELGVPWATVAIGIGATIAAVVLLVRRSGRKYYALAGTVYCVGIAGVFLLTSRFPDVYHQDVMVAAAGLGLISAVIVTLQRAGEAVVKRLMAGKTGEKNATAIYNAVAAILGLLAMIWAVLTAYEKAIRYGSVGVGSTTALALNIIGARFPIPIWFIDGGVDATIVLFVGCTLIAFHTLETLHTTWHATKTTAATGAKAGMKAGKKASEVAGEKRAEIADEN